MHGLQIFNNFLNEDLANWIEKEMVRGNFYWHYIEEVGTYSEKINFSDKRIVNPNGFVHVMSNPQQGVTSPYFASMIVPILETAEKTLGIKIQKVIRARTRMTIPIPGYTKESFSPPHVDLKDIGEPYYTLVYYVNDSDGDFLLFNEKFSNEIENNIENFSFTQIARINPKKNQAIFFDGHTYHSGNAPIENKYRIAINIDFI